MLLANETVAPRFFWQRYRLLYRTHDNPDTERKFSSCNVYQTILDTSLKYQR